MQNIEETNEFELLQYFHFATVADIPGLISGAHENRGLGHAFLRHVERCKALLYVVDVASGDPLPTDQLKSLQFELCMYRPELSARVVLVVANKMDLLTAAEGEEEMSKLERESGLPVVPVSALRMRSEVRNWWSREKLSRTLFEIVQNRIT